MGPAFSQSWPAKPVRVVVPYPPGGATDITARLYAQLLQQKLGQTFLIDNKAGAGGEIGAELVSKSPADGYTVLFGAIGSLAIHASLPEKKSPYNLATAFTGVSMGSSVPLAIAVRATLPVNSLAELLALLKSKPGSLSFGSAGDGSTQHLTGEYFQQATGTRLVHVPYKGSGPAVNDLMGGQIDLVFETLPALAAQVGGGRLKILAVTSSSRSPLLPQIATLDELGVKGFSVSTLYGVLAPRGTPKDVIDKLSMEMQAIGRTPSAMATMQKQGAELKTSTPEETDALIKGEVEKWARVIKSTTRT
ncbi:MAG: tripartite tricarboxylate transporter substrate binding protein [Lacisediminimonas sp.]|nr:tripartite tricarboxylate transporter substrate binding protein [Lacisediminimonas sp.]